MIYLMNNLTFMFIKVNELFNVKIFLITKKKMLGAFPPPPNTHTHNKEINTDVLFGYIMRFKTIKIYIKSLF